jgi:hypothetical protein
MYDRTIKRILQGDPVIKKLFKGFSNPDRKLPNLKRKPAVVVLNTDSFKGPGEHWCIVIFDKNNVCEFFDPLGKKPSFYKFHKCLFEKCKMIRYNKFPVQSKTSINCGHHCLFYVHHRARGLDPAEIMFFYSKEDLDFNDRMVYTFILENYGEHFANDDNPLDVLRE